MLESVTVRFTVGADGVASIQARPEGTVVTWGNGRRLVLPSPQASPSARPAGTAPHKAAPPQPKPAPAKPKKKPAPAKASPRPPVAPARAEAPKPAPAAAAQRKTPPKPAAAQPPPAAPEA